MNVLIISHMYPSSYNRMSGVFVHSQVRELIKLGCEVVVICPIPWAGFPLNVASNKWKSYSEVPYKKVMDDIQVYYPRYIEFPKGFMFNSSGKRMYNSIKKLVYKLNREKKFDLIHSHVALPDGYCGMRLSKKLKIPYLVTVHGQDFQYTIRKSEKLKNTVYEVLNRSDKIIVVSNKLKNVIKQEEFSYKIEIVHNGINEEVSKSHNMDMSKIPKDIDILSASNLVKTKGIDLNIQAMRELTKKNPKLKYYIIGDGHLKESLMKMVEDYGLKNNVIFVGKLPHDEVMEWMKRCKIFSLPSWEEGFGVVYIEAMLQGKPVIGVKGQGIEDAVANNKNGFLVNSRSVEEIVSVIQSLLEDKNLRLSIGEKARNTVIESFTWRQTTKTLWEIYNRLI